MTSNRKRLHRQLKMIVDYCAPLCMKPISVRQLQLKIHKELGLFFTHSELLPHLRDWLNKTSEFESRKLLKKERNK